MRHREEDRHDDGREQLEVVRVELQPEDDDHDRIVDHAAEHHKQQPDGKIAALREDRVAEHLADDDRGESNDDRAAAHADIRRALILGHQTAREGNHAVREAESDDLHRLNVDALCAAHRRVGAGGAHRAALLGAEVPVEQSDRDHREHEAHGDSYLRRENEKWFDVESVFSNALNTINLMPPLIETMEINGIEPKEAIKQIQRYQVNANICLDQILTSLDSADYRKVRTLSNSMERAREKFCQVMQNRAEIYEKLFRVNEKEIAERILEVEKQEQKSLPIRVRMRCQEAVARAHGLNFDELKIELEQLNEATAKMHADIFRPLLQLKQRTFELIRTELSQKADRILNFGGDTHADT